MRFTTLLKMCRVKLLGRTIDLRSLFAEWMNKLFRETIEFLFDRFECQDLCAVVELEKLLDILRHAHELLSKHLSIDSFNLMINEMLENISLVSYSSRLSSQITTLEPMITRLQEALPKSIGLLPFDAGVTGQCCGVVAYFLLE